MGKTKSTRRYMVKFWKHDQRGSQFKWMPRALVALVFVLATSGARAQDEASISGNVTDATGSAIPRAAVKVTNTETGFTRSLLTDDTGRFDAPLLPVGSYEVVVGKSGFSEGKGTVTLAVGEHASVDFTLAIAGTHQAVQVEAGALGFQVTTADASGLVTARQVKDLPLNGRSYDQLLTLNAGVINYTSQRASSTGTSNSVVGNMFAVSGRRPQQNLFLLNGVEFTGASEINNTPGGTSGQLLGVEAVREFSVVRDAYGAEFGKRPGAQINIVTLSGTNQLHGAVYEFLRNAALDARNFFDSANIPPLHRNVFGGSLGGPMKKDRAFLFGNYEGFRQALGLSDVTLVPDAASRAAAVPGIRPLLNLWPQANGPELLTSAGAPSGIAEAFSNPLQHVREDFGTARFDQNFSDQDSLAAVYTVDDSEAHSPTSNPFSRADVFLREQVASVSETHVFSSGVLNKATLGFSRGGFYFNSGVTGPAALVPGGWIHAGDPAGTIVIGGGTTLNGASQLTNGGTNAGSNLSQTRNLFTATDQVSLARGIHLLSSGAWLQPLQANDNMVQDQYGQASFSNLQNFLKGTVSTFTYAPAYTPLSWRSLEGAFYAQDAVRLRPNLEVQLGFRAEFTNGWNEARGRASNYVFDSSGAMLTQPVIGPSVFSENNAKFLPAPRLGIAWSPPGSKKTVVHAGFGIYYGLNDTLDYRLDQVAPFNTIYQARNVTFSSIAPNAAYAGARIVPSGVQANLQTPSVESYTLKIEQQLARDTTLSVGYIGSHGYHEILSIDANVPLPTICPASPCPKSYPAGTWYNPPNSPLANRSLLNSTHWFSEGISSYNGLEVDLNHRTNRGLQFRGVYTFAKALNDGDSLNTSVATNSPAFASNPLLPKLDYGRGSFDVRHAAVITVTYELPLGRRRSAQATPWVKRFLGNWQVSGIETIQSGLPFTPQLSYNPSNDGDGRNPVRPSLDPNFSGPIILGNPARDFDPAAFIPPLAGTYGNAPRNFLQGPGLAETDLSLAKKVSITERVNLQFRAEIFNLFNHTNLNTPNPVVFTSATGGPSPTAGVITATSTTSRQIQLGLKLLW